MPLKPNINDREFDKFVDVSGDTAVRTTAVGPTATTPSGLSVGGNIKMVELVSTEWRPLPATARSPRNFLAVQNFSGDEIAVIHADDYIADNNTPYENGWKVINFGERNWDVRNGIVIYGRAKVGTLTVKTEELE